MMACLITFRSVTPAQRGEAMLKRAGIGCSLQRTPKWMEEQGCGYSLRIPCRYVLEASEMLKEGEVPYRKVYLRHENGKLEEITP